LARPLGGLRPALFDRLTARFERRFGEKRRLLLAPTSGRVLEIGAGTGWSFRHYPDAVEEIVALEPDDGMRERGEQRAAASGRPVRFVGESAESLSFEDESFDAIVSMAVLCTVPDVERALLEVRRVLRPGGALHFVEHVRAESPTLARWQDRLERPWGFVAQGCHPNRDTLAALSDAGFEVEVVERGELPLVPPIVRPYVLGRAVPAGDR
jgi:ubiquinone/menaquinone biosynthesis C-methylase UbiE